MLPRNPKVWRKGIFVLTEAQWKSVVLIAKPGALDNEALILNPLRSAGYEVAQVSALPQAFGSQPTIVVAHFDSLLQNSKHINAYFKFLRQYSRHKQTSALRLILLSPPYGKGPEMFVGWETLVDAYLTIPFSVNTLIVLLGRLTCDASA